METKEKIKELELNYGYKFNPKEKHEFDWLCNLIKDVETVVSKNESLHDVSYYFAEQYAEFCVRCDREGLPLIKIEDYLKQL